MANQKFWEGLARHIISKPMTYISWTTYACPSCKTRVDVHAGANVGICLGPEIAKCKCGQVLSTHCREWVNLNKAERRNYLLPIIDVVIVTIFLVLSLILNVPSNAHLWMILSILGLYALVPISKLSAIRDSRRRCRRLKSEMTHDKR